MDHRQALAEGFQLSFPGMTCTVAQEIGRGSNAIVYKGTYADAAHKEHRHTVLIKELFPFHPQNLIHRDQQGGVVCEAEGEALFALHRASFEHGNAIHLHLLNQYPEELGANLNTFELNGTCYSVLGYSGGASLLKRFENDPPTLRELVVLMVRLLNALESFHNAGYLHLDIAPDNILLTGRPGDERVILIDYNSAGALSAPMDDNAYFSIKEGYTAPEISSRRFHALGIPSDLYSVAAVFYRGLMDRPLTLLETLRPAEIDVSGAPIMQGQPDTVCTFVNQLLRQGLHSLPKRRFASVWHMNQSLQELLARIDGVGVTHWALWESARRNVDRLIRDNPSLAYLLKPDALYPSNIEEDGGVSRSAQEMIAHLQQGGDGCQLIAAGGMGKTTALLHAAAHHQAHYSPAEPVVLYQSLYGWKEEPGSFILNRILENLRFGPDITNYEQARHVLRQLLGQTLPGGKPVMVLLLDGFNEASGSAQPLVDEISQLAAMPGVRLVVSTRTPEDKLPLKTLRLSPLSPETVQQVLTAHGLLTPQYDEMLELLRTPMMLAIFVHSALAARVQPSISTQQELIQSYFSALILKETHGLSADSDRKWQTDVAVSLVLPAIARELNSSRTALDDQSLFKAVQRCFRLVRSRMLIKAFPQWIGLSKNILGDAKNAEQWYGLMVRDLLWKRLGLLMRDQHNRYQISHQMLAESLLTIDEQNQQKTWKRRLRQWWTASAVAVSAALLISGSLFWANRPIPYAPEYAEALIAYADDCRQTVNEQTNRLAALLATLSQNPQDASAAIEDYRHTEAFAGWGALNADAQELLDSGDAFAWYGRRMNKTAYHQLMQLYALQGQQYENYVRILDYAFTASEVTPEQQAECLSALTAVLDTNQQMTTLMFEVVSWPGNSAQQRKLEETLHAYEGTRAAQEAAFLNTAAAKAYSERAELALQESSMRIAQDWFAYLEASEAIYSAVTNVYQHIEAFCGQPDWERLLMARTVHSTVQLSPIPSGIATSATDEDYDLVYQNQMDIGFTRLQIESYEQDYSTFMAELTDLSYKLYDQVFLQPELDLTKRKAVLEQQLRQYELRYLALATNHLLLQVDEATAKQLRQQIDQQLPVLALLLTETAEEAHRLLAVNHTLDDASQTVDGYEESIHQLEIWMEDMNAWVEEYSEMSMEQLTALAVPLAGIPAMLPNHFLTDGMNDQFLYFWYAEDGTPMVTDNVADITTLPDGCQLFYPEVPRIEFKRYTTRLTARSYAELLDYVMDNDYICVSVMVEGMQVDFEWTPSGMTVTMPQGAVCFVPDWYLPLF